MQPLDSTTFVLRPPGHMRPGILAALPLALLLGPIRPIPAAADPDTVRLPPLAPPVKPRRR